MDYEKNNQPPINIPPLGDGGENGGQIIPLSEGAFTIDKTKIFVPFNLENDDLQQRPIGSLLVEVQPFCIVTEKDIIVIDAGLGFSKGKQLQIHANLLEKGIDPASVTKVLMSHLHKDHAGGVSKKDSFGNYRLAFPNATYYVQKKEFEFAMDTSYPTFMTEEIGVLENNPQVHWLDGDGEIEGFIKHEITGGHSPFHQVFWLKIGGETIFFGGDDAPQLQQMKSKFVAKYDFNGKKCMELRQQWWQQGLQENWIFLFYHDIKTPVYPERV
ncbi:MBL fold metallo-hydrolase [Parasediminibacterium sp. JCM 36343]|uniref:MBL fold metallo-hydrolase n=1 Tax=Parasediminibacterium sp. JCM 36343 TaxID=3374279 RepID=UPI003978D84C